MALSKRNKERTGSKAERDAAAAAVAAAAAATPSSPATARAASQLTPSESPRAAHARVQAANRFACTASALRRLWPRPSPSARDTFHRWCTFFDYKTNGQLRASKGAGYVAKAARASGIVNTINTGPTSKQRVEALRAALAQTDVRATALIAGFATTLEVGSMVVDEGGCCRSTRNRWTPATSLTLVVPSHILVYVGINLESPNAEVSDGWQSLPRTCNGQVAKAAGAVHVHDDVNDHHRCPLCHLITMRCSLTRQRPVHELGQPLRGAWQLGDAQCPAEDAQHRPVAPAPSAGWRCTPHTVTVLTGLARADSAWPRGCVPM
jgi:hypothetical protein